MTCICEVAPKASESIQIFAPGSNKVLAVFNKSCEFHGVHLGPYREMQAVRKRAWVDVNQAWIVATQKEGARLIQRGADGRSALVEWTEFEMNSQE